MKFWVVALILYVNIMLLVLIQTGIKLFDKKTNSK